MDVIVSIDERLYMFERIDFRCLCFVCYVFFYTLELFTLWLTFKIVVCLDAFLLLFFLKNNQKICLKLSHFTIVFSSNNS